MSKTNQIRRQYLLIQCNRVKDRFYCVNVRRCFMCTFNGWQLQMFDLFPAIYACSALIVSIHTRVLLV